MTGLVPPTAVGDALRPELGFRHEDGERLAALLWRAGPGWRMASSAVLGGGIGERGWVLNAQVSHGYRRTDPEAHLTELARAARAHGPGVGLLTAAEVSDWTRGEDGGVEVAVTVGIGVSGWAASPGAGLPAPAAPGTINILAALPVALTDAALVNAVATATEAKVQGLLDAGHDCSGTPTDAVCVAARVPRPAAAREALPATAGGVHAFAGPRSVWGARLARAVHHAVLAGARQDRLRRRDVHGLSGERPREVPPEP